ncbi:efflux RND transporter permease subunit [Luethyella okanaganae]|uniref:Efflux RND transporter permease subunit n=1 Tax=Luethyella okanaganae TaxID=69372 RepID=A0ABW1VES0_9MICO
MHLLAVLSMKNRALIALVTVVVAVFGGIALTSLKQELAPSISFPQLVVMTQYPGAAPEVVNDDVSSPIESAIRGIAGLESTSTTSTTNLSIVNATFAYGTNLSTVEQKMTSAINRIKSRLPESVDPQVISASFDDFPVLQIAVTGADDASTLSDELKRTTLGEIQDVDGVREAALVGDVGKRVTITPDVAELVASGLTSQAIRDALQQNGVLIPAGSITQNDKTLSVQAGSKLASVDDIAGLPLVSKTVAPGGTRMIGDVASVAVTGNPVTSISRVDGKPALTIAVTKLPAANTVEVSKAVRAILPDLEASLQTTNPGATLTVVFDQAPFIQQSIDSLATEGLLGLFFAVIVILVFLLSVRATLVTAISIPTSVLITFIGLQVADYTLNILTLGALTIAIGRVVDDSIVVIENIKRHLVDGVDRGSTIVRAVREVAGAITASTITTVAVFLPVALVEGVTGELFRPFSLTVTIALLASLFVALTIVPVLAYWFLRPALRHKHAGESTEALEVEDGVDELEHPSRLQLGYLPIIRWTLRHSVVTIVVALLVLGGTVALTPLMKTNFLGDSGQNTFRVSQTLPVGTSLEAMDAASKEVEQVIRGATGVEIVQTSIGSSGSPLRDAFSGGGSGAITYSVTTDENANQVALQDEVRASLGRLGDVGEISIAASSGFGASSDIEVDVTASNQEDLSAATDAVLAKVSELSSIKQASSNLAESRPYIGVVVNRASAASVGYSEVALGGLVAQAMQPSSVGSVVIDETSLTIYIATETPPATEAELAALQIPTPAGPVALDTLATVSQVDGPASITTVRGLRSATVSATPDSDNLGTASTDVQRAVNAAGLPNGASASLGGVTADQGDAFSQLGIALLVAILIVYIVMVATFRSLLQPLLLLVSVPFAATGAIALQVLTGIPLGVASLIGVLMLIGIVVTNAIVLVDLVNQYRRRGMSVEDALVHGASRRLRPILMTALATIFALLPMAIGLTGHGGFISQPLALVVIGGLVSSTALTLVVLPVLYKLVEGGRERRTAKRASRGATQADADDAAELVQPFVD